MARIKLGIILQNIAGSIGEYTYACWKGVNYIRSKAVSISNPSSGPQADIRARIGAGAKRWFGELTPPQRAIWEEYAQQQGSAEGSTGPNSNGGSGQKVVIPQNNGVMSGFNAYVMHNSLLFSAGLLASGVFIDDAPLNQDPPNAPTDLDEISSPPSCPVLTWVDPVGMFASDRIRLWTRSDDAGVHRQLVASVAKGVEQYIPWNLRVALGNIATIATLPGHYHWQADCVGGYGKSSPSNVTQFSVELGCTAVP